MYQKLLLFFISLTFSTIAFAMDLSSPVGNWLTISDKTHDRSGIVEIYENNGKMYGKILKIFPGNGRDPAEHCVNCPGNFKDKPVQGLVFLWDFEKQSDGSWANGKILDPKEGNIYKGSFTLIDNGKKLQVRGYWTIFWRTQIWIRQEP